MVETSESGSGDTRGALPRAFGRLVAVWFVANFVIVGAVSALAGRWYLGWTRSSLVVMLAELGLIQLPNLLLPLWLLRREGVPLGSLRSALGWRWSGWRTLAAGVATFALSLGLDAGVTALVGGSIPYNLPGAGGGIAANNLPALVGLLLLLLLFVGLTTAAEETMFRGLLQTHLTAVYGPPAGILGTALLFGLRHLPPTCSTPPPGTPRRRCGWRGCSSCTVGRCCSVWRATMAAPLMPRGSCTSSCLSRSCRKRMTHQETDERAAAIPISCPCSTLGVRYAILYDSRFTRRPRMGRPSRGWWRRWAAR